MKILLAVAISFILYNLVFVVGMGIATFIHWEDRFYFDISQWEWDSRLGYVTGFFFMAPAATLYFHEEISND